MKAFRAQKRALRRELESAREVEAAMRDEAEVHAVQLEALLAVKKALAAEVRGRAVFEEGAHTCCGVAFYSVREFLPTNHLRTIGQQLAILMYLHGCQSVKSQKTCLPETCLSRSAGRDVPLSSATPVSFVVV